MWHDILPKLLLTRLLGYLADLRAGWMTRAVIRWFIRHYQVDMRHYLPSESSAYSSFNEFFTRALKPNARPVDLASRMVSPVDGVISQCGVVKQGMLIQAKGRYYSLVSLLATVPDTVFAFEHFACLYLSPKDYHRIHMPCDGTLISMKYVPGQLFSVNPSSVNRVDNLFARNERVVCEFLSPQCGRFVLVLVGAMVVGSMATVWHGIVKGGQHQTWHYKGEIHLKQGEEMGRFLLGSTVIILCETGMRLNPSWQSGVKVRMGEAMMG